MIQYLTFETTANHTENAVLYYYILICEYAKALRPKELAIMQKGTGNGFFFVPPLFSSLLILLKTHLLSYSYLSFNEFTESALQIWLAPGNTEMDVAKNVANLELLIPPCSLEQLPPLTVRHPLHTTHHFFNITSSHTHFQNYPHVLHTFYRKYPKTLDMNPKFT